MPQAFAGLGMGGSALGGLIGAAGSEYMGQAQANMYNYQAGVAQINSQLATQNENYAIASGNVQGQQIGMKGRAQLGATRVGFGAGNVAGGSTNRVEASETELTQQSEAVNQANAAKKAYGFNVQSAEQTAQAGAYQAAAQTSLTSGNIGAISSIIGGATGVASQYMQYQKYF